MLWIGVQYRYIIRYPLLYVRQKRTYFGYRGKMSKKHAHDKCEKYQKYHKPVDKIVYKRYYKYV